MMEAGNISPKDAINVIEAAINFLDITLLEENLSPSICMDRQETVDCLNKLVENLQFVKSFEFVNLPPQTVAREEAPAPIVTKQPCAIIHAPQLGIVETLKSKLRIFTKMTATELKQHSDYSGTLSKYKKQLFSKWNTRHCVLCNGILFYFETENDSKGKGYIIVGCYNLTSPSHNNAFTFNLESYNRSTTYMFQADQKREIDGWKEELLKVTSQQYTPEELQAINNISKEFKNNDDDYGEVPNMGKECGDAALPPTQSISGQEIEPCGTPPQQQQPEQVCDELYEELDIKDTPPVAVTPVATPQTVPHKKGCNDFLMSNVYMGQYDCLPDHPQDLSFKRGDMMYILDRVDADWWMGYLRGKVGLVPRNFLTEAFTA